MSIINLIHNAITGKYEASYPSIGTANPLLTETGVATLTNKTITSLTALETLTIGGVTPLLRLGASSNGVGLNGTTTAVQASDGGNYFYVAVGDVIVNSATLTLTNAGVARVVVASPADGTLTLSNTNATIGSRLKIDALPTIASGFGTAPSVTAGSTPLAGSVNVGTGGVATSGVILFNGTAFPSAPFVVVTCSAGAVPTTVVVTTTQITFTTSVAWPASTIVSWVAISARA